VMLGDLHILDDEMNELPTGQPGTIWFKTATPFEYHNDPGKTAESTSPDGTMTTVGDVGYVDEDNFLYLTDRKTFMIISGGVNIYPQETEDLLITHPKVYDAAVIGVPNEELAFCREHLGRQKVPRSIDYEDELPRLPTGKLYKRKLRDRYWDDGPNQLV
jgi:long-chain acyl-CoA synthetase